MRKCNDCNNPAIFGNLRSNTRKIRTYNPIHCEDHSIPGEIDLRLRPCIKCHYFDVLNENDLCATVCQPIKISERNYLKKQGLVIDYLTSRNYNPSSIDKIIVDTNCGKERPDIVFKLPDRIIIVEVDEFQHRDRNTNCESVRMFNIMQSIGETLPVIFIRYNPDRYYDINKNPKRNNNPEKIIEKLNEIMNIPTEDLIRRVKIGQEIMIIYLYYNGYDPRTTDWEIIDPTL